MLSSIKTTKVVNPMDKFTALWWTVACDASHASNAAPVQLAVNAAKRYKAVPQKACCKLVYSTRGRVLSDSSPHNTTASTEKYSYLSGKV